MENNFIYGRNSVLEALLSGKREINKILLSQTARGDAVSKIIKLARQKGIVLQNCPPKKLDKLSANSQGIAAEISPAKYEDIENLIEAAKKKTNSFLAVLDSIEDPHNLGAIIRNCAAFGAVGVVIPKRHSASVNETVSKTSAGAIEHIDIARVSNINQTIELLKENGFWIYGLDRSGKDISGADFVFPTAIVVGGEGNGLHRLTKEKCDFLISIPQSDSISSLNASCASAVALYEISKRALSLV
ncbi:MAG: 23S rRNA (guanosine(2251)-2'-O)-methyltransferase RlmB [Elusimicrobiota bacterium]|nr:23S rRNA (guanosine(2251)-2'-O)-methyltransferase RlmB [Elusimicrobiota bacterium]